MATGDKLVNLDDLKVAYDELKTRDLTSDVTGVLPIANGGTGGATAAAARTNLEVPMVMQLTGTTWSSLYTELTKIPIGYGALVNISGTAVTSALSGGQFALACRGMIFRLPTSGATYDIQMNIGVGTLYSWRIEGLTSASATPTVDPVRRYAPFVLLSNDDTTWADLWNLLSVVPTSGTSTVYVNGTPATMISGGAIASACDGFVARYGSGLGFNFTLVQQTTGKLFNVVVTFNSAHDNATVGTVYEYSKVGTEIVTQEYSQAVDAFSAGAAGSRAVQYTVSVDKTGYTPIAVSLSAMINTVVIHQQVGFRADRKNVYINIYRASGAEYTGGGTIKFIVVYQKN